LCVVFVAGSFRSFGKFLLNLRAEFSLLVSSQIYFNAQAEQKLTIDCMRGSRIMLSKFELNQPGSQVTNVSPFDQIKQSSNYLFRTRKLKSNQNRISE